ncbi:large subunit ribosomal protein L17 [Dethiosulfatibacter aminovorans DSM 17477]|uniref:Large ribosomal subunit protein bL17 n=1 Tax=Dethiosulfatibacter aminovorans DSM 17477 TaxID=1121476 RepID=A0A1M6L6X2_9FIRM|nr:50S ribosomal protein L17 [Dethiosulfatibacter aminovorans]SHJ66932.1 large subunit ribosomal protein L17 [Dethiosulfatibacter aminovorans DSM 17477]
MGKYRKLGRPSDQRMAMLRNMTASLIENGRIQTTDTRAKEVRKFAEKMVTLGKRGDLHARRQALSFIYDKNTVAKLFEEVAPKYEDRNGGYTRILKIGPRRGDGAEMVIIELV